MATWPKTWIWASWPWDGQCYKGLVKRIAQVWTPSPKLGFGLAGHGGANVIKGLQKELYKFGHLGQNLDLGQLGLEWPMLEKACKKKCAGLATWPKTWIWANWPWECQCYKKLVKGIVQVWPLGPKL